MRWITRISYGVGQMQKDLVGDVINIFILLYLEKCLEIGTIQVGTLLLFGQVINAVSTPLIGVLSDQAALLVSEESVFSDELETQQQKKSCWQRLVSCLAKCRNKLSPRRRKALHLYGSLAMTICLPLLFGQPRSFGSLPLWSKLLISGVLFMFIQLGWAAVQIAHLTLLNYLTNEPSERVLLVSLRYFFGSTADISSFLLSYLFLSGSVERTISKGSTTELVIRSNVTSAVGDGLQVNQTAGTSSITVEDMPLIRNITLALVIYGLLPVTLFQCFVPERAQWDDDEKSATNAPDEPIEIPAHIVRNPDEFTSIASGIQDLGLSHSRAIARSLDSKDYDFGVNKPTEILRWYGWFAKPRFWICCCTFSSIRVGIALALLYLSPFLLNTLEMEKSSIALVPLATFVCCLLATMVQSKISKCLGRVGNASIGIVFALSYCIMVFFCEAGGTNRAMVYCAAGLLGVGSAFSYVLAIVVISDMIGTSQVNTAAFVQGFASLFDKIFQGILVQIIQLAVPRLSYRHVETYIVGSLILLGGLCSIFDWYHWNSKRSRTTK
ncbi:unnamed protein product [Calicophoron daubneyi]|uniref:Solute carrier family 40 protein n=1 Tax=Calicophoron daubneyi TaxID=300641 RepID=A0AAV2TJ03_CALDB